MKKSSILLVLGFKKNGIIWHIPDQKQEKKYNKIIAYFNYLPGSAFYYEYKVKTLYYFRDTINQNVPLTWIYLDYTTI